MDHIFNGNGIELENKIKDFYRNIADCKDKKDAVRKVAECVVCCAYGLNGRPELITEKMTEEFKSAMEFLSDGENTVIADDRGIPSVMVKIENYTCDYLDHSFANKIHPAFIIGESIMKYIYIAKYQNFIYEGRGYSLPFAIPSVGLGLEEALRVCMNKGKGWKLSYYALRAAIALRASKQGFLPRGNSESGHDYIYKEEQGILIEDGLVETGSGPITWSHDNTVFGIYDLCGNLNEWDTGLRLKSGELQVIPNGNCMLEECDYKDNSKWWRAILSDGSLVMPGSQGTLKFTKQEDRVMLTTAGTFCTNENFGCALRDIVAEDGLVVPELIKQLALYPISGQWDYGYGWRWVNTNGECAPLSGGAYLAEDHAGIYFTGMTYPRNHKYKLAGFRTVYFKDFTE